MKTRNVPLTASAITTLSILAQHVLANPKMYDADHFVADFEGENQRGSLPFLHSRLTASDRALKLRVTKHTDWLLHNTSVGRSPFYTAAQKDLHLTDDQAQRLLGGVDRWPKKFYDWFLSAKTPKGRARVLADRITFFIKTDGSDVTPVRGTKSSQGLSKAA